ncbi:MAG: DUF4339 domain-containing protein [Planctomycetota bacterium]|nr:DUF4339 domain-containing protein [Planctomycetota bacterium]
MAEWYYGRKGQHKGPVTQGQLQTLSRTGRLKPTDLVWHAGLPEWLAVEQVPELQESIAEASTKVWFYGEGGQQQGPASLLELRESLTAGRITPQWLVWKDGMSEWTAAANVPELAVPKKSSPVAPTRTRSATPVADSDLVAGFRQESKVVAAGEEIRGLFKRAKTKVRVKKLQFEIAGMEKTLRTEYVAAGQQTLESGGDNVDLAAERTALQQLLASIQERQDRLNAVAGSSGTGSIRRELQTEIDSLNLQSKDVFRTIGEKAFAAGALSPETAGKISNLESVVDERRAALDALAPIAAEVDRSSSRWVIGGGILIAACIVLGMLVWGGTFLWDTAFGNQLSVYRYLVPANTDSMLFIDGSILETEAFRSLGKRIDSKRLDPDKDDVNRITEFTVYSSSDKDVPRVELVHARNEIELKKDRVKQFDKREHAGETYWVSKTGEQPQMTFYRTSQHDIGFALSSSASGSLDLDKLTQHTKDLIEQSQKQHETKAYLNFKKWLAEVSNAHLVLADTDPDENDTLTTNDALRELVADLIFTGDLTIDHSEITTALNYLKPEESPAKLDDDLEALIVSLTLDDEIHAEERAYFSSENNAKDYVELFETKISDSKTAVKDKDFRGTDNLKLNVRKLLSSAEIVREGKCVIFRCNIPSRLLSKPFDDAKGKK